MTTLMSIQETVKAMKPVRAIASPPTINLSAFAEKAAPVLSDSQKAQAIMEVNGLDGMEFGDHPLQQMIERPMVYEIILNLFANGWSYERVSDWCRYAKWSCTFTLNGKIVR